MEMIKNYFAEKCPQNYKIYLRKILPSFLKQSITIWVCKIMGASLTTVNTWNIQVLHKDSSKKHLETNLS